MPMRAGPRWVNIDGCSLGSTGTCKVKSKGACRVIMHCIDGRSMFGYEDNDTNMMIYVDYV